MDHISTQTKGALNAITAAVVGVILNLSIWFAIHALFGKVDTVKVGPISLLTPDINSLDWTAAILSALCALLLLRMHWQIWQVLVASSILAVAFWGISA